MSQNTVNRNFFRNSSYLTGLKRKLHDANREAMELIDCPFINDSDLESIRNVFMQINFCLELLK